MSSPPNLDPPKIPPDFLRSVARVSSISPCLNAFPSRKEKLGTLPAPKAVPQDRQRRAVERCVR